MDEFVVKILISKNNDVSSVNSLYLFDEFILPNTKTYYNDIEWHEANDKYFLLQCNHQNKRSIV